MMSNTMIVRVQSPDGTKRIQTKATERINEFLDKVQREFDLGDLGWKLFKNRNKSEEFITSRVKTLASYKIRHGDMVYLDHHQGTNMEVSDSTPSSSGPSPSGSSLGSFSISSNGLVIREDEVDQYLWKQDGRIQRSRNELMCRHGPSGKCFNCVPLEPYDEEYLKSRDPPIKFLSFHSYLRKLHSGVDKGKFVSLENLSCKIKPGCTEHPPWPGGICTKCQPSAITLNRQTYRHVDYIQFENPFIVERFLNYWRNTGLQRIGLLYGRYEPHDGSPLGIKAVVTAIYEPTQASTRNSVELVEDEKKEAVNCVASELGLSIVGWIFTDLIAEDLSKGTVKHFRGNINSHFLSAEECIMAADFQNQHPNPCKLSPERHFGSKFVTVVVTGDKDNQIHFEGYQVSNQCMALVCDDCLIPTKDAPELGYIKESSEEQYVPDVFYKEKDQYGNEVTQLSRPLPVEYLLVDLPAAFPVEPEFTFFAGNGHKPFSVENRAEIGEATDFNAFTSYMAQFEPKDFLRALSDFHVLLYMYTCDMLPLRDHMSGLLAAVKAKDEELAHHWSKTEEWGTVQQLMSANSPSPPTSRQTSFVGPNASPLPPIGGGSGGASAMWTCAHCTFLNSYQNTSCEICNLPK